MPSAIPLIPLDLDRRRTLRYDFAACSAAELKLAEVWGSRAQVSMLGGETTPVTTLLIYLWAGLLHEEPSLVLEQVGHMIGLSDYPRVSQAVADAWRLSQPEDSAPPAAASNGGAPAESPFSSSGPPPSSTSASPVTTSGA